MSKIPKNSAQAERKPLAITCAPATVNATGAPIVMVQFNQDLSAITLAPAASTVAIPVTAQQLGSYGTAGANLIDTVVSAGGIDPATLQVVSSTGCVGQDSEARAAYIARCLVAARYASSAAPNSAPLADCHTSYARR